MGYSMRTTCGLCQVGCGVLAHVSEGKIVRIEGDPDHPLNRGVLCPKGMASLEYLYHPERLEKPLKRTGERNKGEFTPVSWDQALDIVASKLREHKTLHGPESVAFLRGASKGLQDDYLTRFANLFGSPNITSMGHVCFVPRRTASFMTFGYLTIPDLDSSTGCIIVWGANVSETIHHVFSRIEEAVRRGTKLIVIDPMKSKIAELADIWVKVKPGSDLLLSLSILNIIASESLYDKDFINAHAVGFEELLKQLDRFEPEKTAPFTGVQPDMVKDVARLYGTSKPACIEWGNGIDQNQDNFQAARAICILRAVTGNLAVPGGDIPWIPPPMVEKGSPKFTMPEKIPPELRAKRINGEEKTLPTMFFALPQAVVDTILTGKPYPVTAAFVQGGNLLLTYPNARKVFDALTALDFLVVSDTFMTPTAALADIILPVATYLEFPSIVCPPYANAVASVQQKIVRVGGCRSDYEIIRDLSILMGYGDYFWKTEEECLDFFLEPLALSFAEFSRKGFLTGKKQYRAYENSGFPTPSGKVEIFSQRLEEWGFDPVPGYSKKVEPATYVTTSGPYPLILTTGKAAPFRHSGGRQIKSLRDMHPEPLVTLNPLTASGHGICEGDLVCIETEKGVITQKAAFSDDIDLSTIWMDFAWWYPEKGLDSFYDWDKANVNIIIDDGPPFGREFGTPRLRAIPCRIWRKT